MGEAQRSVAAGEAALIDDEVIEGLRAVFGDAVGALLSKTRSIIFDRLTRMAAAAEAGDADGLRRLAHEVAGMAGQVGLVRLSGEARALESRCAAGIAPEAMGSAVSRLDQTARRSIERLSS